MVSVILCVFGGLCISYIHLWSIGLWVSSSATNILSWCTRGLGDSFQSRYIFGLDTYGGPIYLQIPISFVVNYCLAFGRPVIFTIWINLVDFFAGSQGVLGCQPQGPIHWRVAWLKKWSETWTFPGSHWFFLLRCTGDATFGEVMVDADLQSKSGELVPCSLAICRRSASTRSNSDMWWIWPMGPWIQQNVYRTVRNTKSKRDFKQSFGHCDLPSRGVVTLKQVELDDDLLIAGVSWLILATFTMPSLHENPHVSDKTAGLWPMGSQASLRFPIRQWRGRRSKMTSTWMKRFRWLVPLVGGRTYNTLL